MLQSSPRRLSRCRRTAARTQPGPPNRAPPPQSSTREHAPRRAPPVAAPTTRGMRANRRGSPRRAGRLAGCGPLPLVPARRRRRSLMSATAARALSGRDQRLVIKPPDRFDPGPEIVPKLGSRRGADKSRRQRDGRKKCAYARRKLHFMAPGVRESRSRSERVNCTREVHKNAPTRACQALLANF